MKSTQCTYDLIGADQDDIAESQALEFFRKNPKDPESFLLLAEVLEAKENFEQALSWTKQGLDINPNHPGLLLKQAWIYFDTYEDIAQAHKILIFLDKQISKTPKSQINNYYQPDLLIEIYLLLTDCYRLKSKFDLAFQYAHNLWKIDKNNSNTILTLATSFFEMGEFHKALSLIGPCERWDEAADVHWLKAQIFCAMGKQNKADEEFSRAYKLDNSRYHQPVRLSNQQFQAIYSQAVSSLPKELRDYILKIPTYFHKIISQKRVQTSNGSLSPLACMLWHDDKNKLLGLDIFQHPIENYAHKRDQLRDIIASALLHELENRA